MNFKDLLDYCKAEAINNSLTTTEVSVWREVCRTYSKKFSTPLHLCLDGTIPAEDILLATMEEQLSGIDMDEHLEGILEEIYILEDPEYESARKAEVDDFVEQIEKQEEERLRLGKPIHKAMKQEVTLAPDEPEELPPQKSGGFVDLSYLAKEEDGGKNGF